MRGETNGSPGVGERQKALLACSLVVHMSVFGCNEDTAESQFIVLTEPGAPQGQQELEQTTGSSFRNKHFLTFTSAVNFHTQ